VQPFKGNGTTQYCSNPCPSNCTCWGIFFILTQMGIDYFLQEALKDYKKSDLDITIISTKSFGKNKSEIILHFECDEGTSVSYLIDYFRKMISENQNHFSNKIVNVDKCIKDSNKIRFTYIMYDEISGLYKIGKSINPEFREKTLSSQTPKISLINKCLESIVSERYLHSLFSNKNVKIKVFAF
jgi:hypothetical protein